ncbi:Uncharacterised protein [Vibrio cholerae]|nr:Uncharacterised protein [Vibrio cholerae]
MHKFIFRFFRVRPTGAMSGLDNFMVNADPREAKIVTKRAANRQRLLATRVVTRLLFL